MTGSPWWVVEPDEEGPFEEGPFEEGLPKKACRRREVVR